MLKHVHSLAVVLPAEPPPVDLGEGLLRRGIAAGGIGVWAWDVTDGRLSWSSSLAAIHRLPRDAFDGTFEAFFDAVHPDDRAGVAAAIRETLAGGDICRVEYRLPAQPGAPDQWLEARGAVMRDGGRATMMTGICRDITQEKAVEAELVRQARRQEAVATLGREALAGAPLDEVLRHAVALAADLLGVEFAEIFELPPGSRSLVLRAAVGWDPALVGAARIAVEDDSQAGYTMRASGPVVVEDLATEGRFCGPSALHDAGIVSGMSVAVTGDDRRAYGLVGVHTRTRRAFSAAEAAFLQALANVVASAIQRQRAQDAQELLIGELQHRAGNLFALVLSLLTQTARGAACVADLERALRQRIGALARAHTLILRGGWRTTTLKAIIREILAPYLDRTSLSGEEVHLPAEQAFALSMALHELATNAGKYGCFADDAGRLDVVWRICREKARPRLVVEWTEHCGRPIEKPSREGFGSQLIRQVIERRLDGKLRQTFLETGLAVRLVLPAGG